MCSGNKSPEDSCVLVCVGKKSIEWCGYERKVHGSVCREEKCRKVCVGRKSVDHCV